MSFHPTSEDRVSYGTTFDGKSITKGIRPVELAEGMQIDYRHGGKFVQNLKFDFEREGRVTFSIVGADNIEFARCDMGYEDILTLIVGERRVAEVTSGAESQAQVAAYLPGNYQIVADRGADQAILIEGFDNCGWTLEGYVIPRLASGLIFATEVQ